MLSNLTILAAVDEGLGKFLGLAIIVGLWILGAILNALSKQRKTQQQWQQTVANIPPAQRPAAQGPPLPLPWPRPKPPRYVRPIPKPVIRAPRRTPAPPRRQASVAAPVLPAAPPLPRAPVKSPAETPAPFPYVAATKVDGPPPAGHVHPSSPAAQAAATFLKPAMLRSQFILTEILQPPLALRRPERSEVGL